MYDYGQKSIEISWKSMEISEKVEIRNQVAVHAGFLLRIHPFTIVNYKADPAAAHVSCDIRPAGHVTHRYRGYATLRVLHKTKNM